MSSFDESMARGEPMMTSTRNAFDAVRQVMHESAGVRTGETSGGVQKTPSLRRSCEHCRASKTRCLPGANGAKTCQRCTRDSKECIFAATQQRAKRRQKSQVRVAEIEEKINGIFAMLSSQKRGSGQDQTPTQMASPDRSTTNSASSQSGAASQVNTPNEFSGQSYCTFREPNSSQPRAQPYPPTPSSTHDGERYCDVIERGIILPQAAEFYVQSFKFHVERFPFVVLPTDITLDELRQDRPFLLLSVMALGASLRSADQLAAEKELKFYMAQKIIVEGVRNLDLIQGLMIYLAWYNRYIEPPKQQLYQFLQLCVSIAVDVGITKPKKTANGSDPFENQTCDHQPIVSSRRSVIETQRTMLGCYFLSAGISALMRKPNNFRYTQYMEECCNNLAEKDDAPLDHMILQYIKLIHILDDTMAVFGFDGSLDPLSLGSMSIELTVKGLESRLKNVRESFKAKSNGTISMLSLYVDSYIHQIALHVDPEQSSQQVSQHQQNHLAGLAGPSSSPSSTLLSPWAAAPFRTTCLIRFLENGKAHLEAFLALSSKKLTHVNVLETTGVIFTIMLFGFATDLTAPSLSAEQIRESAHFAEYCDRLSALGGERITFVEGEPQKDLYFFFKAMFDRSKAMYERRQRVGFENMQQEPAALDGSGSGAVGSGGGGGRGDGAGIGGTANSATTGSTAMNPEETAAAVGEATAEMSALQTFTPSNGGGGGDASWQSMDMSLSGFPMAMDMTDDGFWSDLVIGGWPNVDMPYMDRSAMASS